MANQNDLSVQWLAKSHSKWRMACDLLDSGQYEPIARLLHELQETNEQVNHGILEDLLVVAYQICLACHQCAAEKEWHSRASEESRRREDELKQALGRILEVIPTYATLQPETDFPGRPETTLSQAINRLSDVGGHHSLWQRILGALGWNIASQLPELTVAASVGQLSTYPPDFSKQPSDSPSLIIYCLGPFQVYQDDQPVENWPSSKGKSIFKYMVTHRERPVAKEVLMELFWPDAYPDAARNNLNVAIYGLRQALRQSNASFSHVLFQDEYYLFNPDLRLWVDSEVFIEHLTAARALERRGERVAAVREYRSAEALYQGEFLEEDRYEDWLMPLRQSLQADYLNLLDWLSRYYLDQKEYDSCATMCDKMLAVDPCREEAHRRLMRCYAWRKQPYLALRQYHLCLETLRKELDVPPTDETLALYRRIRAGEAV
jgi:DNA-binding SARP family transcriptional activator